MKCNMTFLVMLYHWHQHQMMLMASSIATLHSLCLDDQSDVQNDFLVLQCYWYQCQCHLMPMTSSHSFSQHDRNEVQHDFSCHAIGTDNGITWYCQHSQCCHYIPQVKIIKTSLTWHFWSCDTIAIGIIWCHWWWCHIMPLGSVSVPHDDKSIINGITVSSR